LIYTTLNRIREHSPCADGWRKLLTHLGKTEADDAPLAYSTILDSNGLDDALWCLRAEPQHASIWRMYAVRCARRVQHLLTDERSLQALDVAERHARGLATDEELDAACVAACVAARGAARGAAWAAARAEQTADFGAMLAAHHAMPGESCALVDWWRGESNA
jgi:hypothetical protein